MKAKEMYRYWDLARQDLIDALGRLTDEQLDFAPKEDMRSIGDVARHIVDAEAGWVNLVVLEEDETWPEYPEDELPTVQSILNEMERVHAITEHLLDKHDIEWLSETREKWGGTFSLRWVFWHILDHEIHHRVEIFLAAGEIVVDISSRDRDGYRRCVAG